MIEIDIVVVTYNRLEKLKKALSCYEIQGQYVRNLIVVNNHSSDGTEEFLSDWKKSYDGYNKVVLNMADNIGGAGGFYEGQKWAMSHKPDWILLADDDAYAHDDLLRKFIDYLEKHDTQDISSICTAVYKTDGSIDFGHRKCLKFDWGINPKFVCSRHEDYNKDDFNIDLFSYVGTFLKREALESAGLGNPYFFIYYDDSEHSIRMNKQGKIVCVPSLKFIHDDGAGLAKTDETTYLTWRDYYGIRNKIYVLLRYYPLPGCFWTLSRIVKCYIDFLFIKDCRNLYFTAIFDGIRGVLGRHYLYKPGFSIKK